MTEAKSRSRISPLPRTKNAPQRKIFLRNLKLDSFIGVYDCEKDAPQPIVIDLEADVLEPSDPIGDRLEDVVCYNKLVSGVKDIIAEGHIKLVETLSERIAELALAHPMVFAVRVRVEKPRAISQADAAGVEIYRTKG